MFVPERLSTGATGMLGDEQVRQLRSVLRLSVGDEIVVFDGSGAEARATIATLDRSSGSFQIEAVHNPRREPGIGLTVGLALLRGERFEIAVQKLTEIGVRRITPLSADRCVVSYSDAREWAKRASRLERIAREAAEQSERVTLPKLDSPVTVAEFLERERGVIALIERADAVRLHDLPSDSSVTIAVGPEGGWSDAEINLLAASGVTAASLGSLILRAETAAIVAAGTIIQAAWARQATTDGI